MSIFGVIGALELRGKPSQLKCIDSRTPQTSQKPSRRTAASSWLARSVARLLGRTKSPDPDLKPARAGGPPVALTRAETTLLPPFAGLGLDRIHVPITSSHCEAAAAEILAAGIAGFDTESRPNFKAGEKSTGPHVVQFALADRAFIFQLRHPACLKVAAELIASDRVLKVGFGLRNDHGQIRNRLGVQLQNVIDLDHVFRKRGYRGQLGVRAAMGAVLGRGFPKSKSTTTSNWAANELSSKQLLYAANDAFAALTIKQALDR